MWSYGEDDAAMYRAGYPGKSDDQDDNLQWYKGQILTLPGRLSVRDFAPDGELRGDYEFLEDDHAYVQWLFPIREQGMNYQAQPLMLHEAAAIAEDEVLQARALDSYECMLDFYGMRLVSRETGEIARTEPASHCEERYENLRMYSHNYLRITRMLKFLGEIGLERLKIEFLRHAVHEIYVTKELRTCRSSCRDYWSGTLRSDKEREELKEQVARFEAECKEEDDRHWSSSGAGWWNVWDDDDSDGDYYYCDDSSSDEAPMAAVRPVAAAPPPTGSRREVPVATPSDLKVPVLHSSRATLRVGDLLLTAEATAECSLPISKFLELQSAAVRKSDAHAVSHLASSDSLPWVLVIEEPTTAESSSMFDVD